MKKILLLFFFFIGASIGINAQTFVTFAVDLSNEAAVSEDGVSIAGNFQAAIGADNDWAPGATMLSDEDGDGIYTLTVQLDTGQYEYKFLNGIEWGTDETTVTEECGAPNGYDGFNRLLTISEGDADVTAAYIFNSCEEIAEFTSIEEVSISQEMTAAPNPFSDRTKITYTTSDEEVRIVVYNLVGQAVNVLKDDFHTAGTHEVVWDGTDESGRTVATGQYFYIMEAESTVMTKSLLLVK